MSQEKEVIAIILDDVLSFHQHMEETFVMDKGIHDIGLLESAVSSPFQTFGGQDLYPSIIEKAARLCYGLAKNHPFVMAISVQPFIVCSFSYISMDLIYLIRS